MPFLVRSAEIRDVGALLRLAKQATLVSLYPDEEAVAKSVENSMAAFSSETVPDDAVYIFVLEDPHTEEAIGVSMIFADYGTRDRPYYYLRMDQRQYVDHGMNIVMNHEILRLEADTQGLSLTGGVVVDARYRNHPGKLGKLIAHMRYIYMGMFPNRFQSRVIGEVAAPLTDSGRNLFWESIGEKFTGVSFKDFLELNRTRDMDFIGNLFPKEDIYLCLLDESLRPSTKRVRKHHGKIATRLVTGAGYRFTNMAHLHGGPVYIAETGDIPYIRGGQWFDVRPKPGLKPAHSGLMLAGYMAGGSFRGALIPCFFPPGSQCVYLNDQTMNVLSCRPENAVFLSPALVEPK